MFDLSLMNKIYNHNSYEIFTDSMQILYGYFSDYIHLIFMNTACFKKFCLITVPEI